MPGVGMDRRTGRRLEGWAHVVQSIEDIITTRVLSRVMRRSYGSIVGRLIDAPANQQALLAFYVAIAEALTRWEPRFALDNVAFVDADAGGRFTLRVAGRYMPRGHLGDRTVADQQSAVIDVLEGIELGFTT